jgi:hypothetical protein
METIKDILIRRDNMTPEDADQLIEDATRDLQDRLTDPDSFGDPEDICMDWFGLEMDYMMELL